MCPSLWEFGQFFPRTWSGRKDQRLIEHLNKERRKEIEIVKCYIIFLFKLSLHNDNYFDHSKQLSKLLKNLVHTIKASYFQVMFMLFILFSFFFRLFSLLCTNFVYIQTGHWYRRLFHLYRVEISTLYLNRIESVSSLIGYRNVDLHSAIALADWSYASAANSSEV